MRIASISAACAGVVLAGSLAFAQPQGRQVPVGRNLQVLPRDIDRGRLMQVMQGFARALGVQCGFCHTGRDFASDANPHKDVARGMMRMTMRINGELLPAVAGLHGGRVTCFTCHRGSPRPAGTPPPREPEPTPPPPEETPPPPPPAHIAPDTPARPY